MKAKIKPGYDQKRQRLADIVPLEAPFTLFVSPTQVCNFRCFYCTQSKSEEEKKKIGFQQVHMQEDLFDLSVEQAKKFHGKIKRVVFTGLGEPLANPKIAEMIQKMAQEGIAGGYEIITNAYLLSHEMTDKLLDAGLTYLRVSIQGLTAKKYKENVGVEIDFNKLIDNLTYFYHKKGNCKLYIKIMDACFEEGETIEQFYEMFGDICDHIYMEHLIKAQPSMMDDYGKEVNSTVTFYGDISEERWACPYPFYTLQLDAIGNTFPCPPLGLPQEFSLGNIREKSLWDIWNSKKLFNLYETHLKKERKSMAVCGDCENYLCFTPKEDNLDEDTEIILKRLEEKRNG